MHAKMLLSMIATATFAASPTHAQNLTGTLQKIKDTGTITLGHRESSVPFSYYDDKQQVVGYAMDLCARIVDGVKKDLKLANLETKLNPVTSATRIPLIANGTTFCSTAWSPDRNRRRITRSPPMRFRSSPTASCSAATMPRSRKSSMRP